MGPQQYPTTPQEPVYYTPEQVEAIRRSNKNKLIWGLVCLIGPTVLFILTIVLYAVANFMFSGLTPIIDGELQFNESSTQRVVNILVFLVGAVSVLTWLPGIIAGIVLLTTRKHL